MIRSLPSRAVPPTRSRSLAFALGTLFVLAFVRTSIAEESLRLPGGVVPQYYQEIRLDLDAGEQDYSGSVRIDLRVTSEVPAIHFHAQEMTLTRVELKGKGKSGPLEDLGRLEGGLHDGKVRASDGMPVAPGDYTLVDRLRERLRHAARPASTGSTVGRGRVLLHPVRGDRRARRRSRAGTSRRSRSRTS